MVCRSGTFINVRVCSWLRTFSSVKRWDDLPIVLELAHSSYAMLFHNACGPNAAIPSSSSSSIALLSSPIGIFFEPLPPPPPRDAAALACVCANAARAYREGPWPRAVRIKLNGAVLEPASGAFDVTVIPGEGVQAAVDRCPPGGSVLLLPGLHEGPLELLDEVHVFGRGKATLRTAAGDVLSSWSDTATCDGLIIRQEANVFLAYIDDEEMEEMDYGHSGNGVNIVDGALRLQFCDISSRSNESLFISGGASTNPVVTECTCVGRRSLSHVLSRPRHALVSIHARFDDPFSPPVFPAAPLTLPPPLALATRPPQDVRREGWRRVLRRNRHKGAAGSLCHFFELR